MFCTRFSRLVLLKYKPLRGAKKMLSFFWKKETKKQMFALAVGQVKGTGSFD